MQACSHSTRFNIFDCTNLLAIEQPGRYAQTYLAIVFTL